MTDGLNLVVTFKGNEDELANYYRHRVTFVFFYNKN